MTHLRNFITPAEYHPDIASLTGVAGESEMSATFQVQTKSDQVWRRVHAACTHPSRWLLWRSVRGFFTNDAPTASMVHLITLLAALAAFAIAAALPTAWFFAAKAGLRGEVEIRAQLYAAQVGEAARQDPVL